MVTSQFLQFDPSAQAPQKEMTAQRNHNDNQHDSIGMLNERLKQHEKRFIDGANVLKYRFPSSFSTSSFMQKRENIS